VAAARAGPQRGRLRSGMSAAGGVSDGGTEVVSRFLRGRNVLLVSGDFGPVFVDCYLHLGGAGMVLKDGTDETLKSALAVVALYAATRPRDETLAWTLHFESQGINVFVAAENRSCHLVGRVFGKNVRSVGSDVLHAEVAGGSGERRRSSVQFTGDVLAAAREFYSRSEQRPAKFFAMGGDAFAALFGQPDCDEEWLAGADTGDVAALLSDQSIAPLEVRHYAFCCGCTPEKIAGAIAGALSGRLDEIFGGDRHINVDCPRCGVRHELPRELFA
jgi:molecular chaperone Hsp33